MVEIVTSNLSVSLLGRFQVVLDNQRLTTFRARKVQALLSFLLVEKAFAGESVRHTREALMTLLWPQLSTSAAQTNLRQTIYRLKQAIPELQNAWESSSEKQAFLLTTRDSVEINPKVAYTLDVTEFLSLVKQNKTHNQGELCSCTYCQELLESAASLYQGDFLVDFSLPDCNPFEEWSMMKREQLRCIALNVLHVLTCSELRRGGYDRAKAFAWRQLEIDEYRDTAHLQLMETLVRSGQRSAALTHYERCRQLLADELGVAPSREIETLYQKIQADEIRTTTTGVEPPKIAATGVAGVAGVALAEKPPLAILTLPDEGDAEAMPVFVSREREMKALMATMKRVLSGEGQVQFVVGGAGRGKTALVTEFARQAQGLDLSLLVVDGHCHGQAGIGDPYLPFRELLTQLTGDVAARSGDVLITQQQALRLWSAMPLTVPALVTQAPDLINALISGTDLHSRAATFADPDSPWFRRLGNLVDIPYQDILQQDRLFSQVTAVLKTIAAKRPLLLILEDLHWADAASTSLLFHLSWEIQRSRIMLLGTYRPEQIAPGWGEERHPLDHIVGELKRRHGDIWLNLSAIDAVEGRTFIDAYLDTEPNRLDEGFRESLFVHTEGHPLFTVELLRAMQERGNLKRDEEGRWQAGETIDWDTLPARVEGVIEQRFGRLDLELQSALTVASVEGEAFTAEVVALVQNQAELELVQRLSGEVDKQHRLVRARSAIWVGSRRLSTYRFRHQLFQQYLYQRLDKTERAYLHEAVGRSLEELYGSEVEQVAVKLAWHFEKAGRAKQAVVYLIQAARQAARLGANHQVIELCARGLKLLRPLPETPQKLQNELALQLSLGAALMATKGYGAPETGAAYTRARQLCQKVEGTPQESSTLFGLWGFYVMRGELRTAHELAEQTLYMAQQQEELIPHLNAYRMLGVTLFYLGELSEALEYLEKVIGGYEIEKHGALALRYGSDPGVSSLSYAALCLWLLGYPEQALAYSKRALQMAQELSHPLSLAFALRHTCWLHTLRLDLESALEQVEEEIAVTTEYGIRFWLAAARHDQHWLQGMLGQTEEGIDGMCQDQAAYRETGSRLALTSMLIGLAMVRLKARQIDDGLSEVARALAHCNKSAERFLEADLYRIRGELLWEKGSADFEVEACWQQAIDVARFQRARLLELRATTLLCRLWQQQGKKEEARQMLDTIYGWFNEGFNEPDLLEARQLLQELT